MQASCALLTYAYVYMLVCGYLFPQHPALNPEVEAALKQLLASPEVKAQFHDPAVHAALQEVRSRLHEHWLHEAALVACLMHLACSRHGVWPHLWIVCCPPKQPPC